MIKCFLLEPIPDRWRFYEPNGESQDGGKAEYDALKWETASPLYRRSDTGEIIPSREAPVGAMIFNEDATRVGPDGKSLRVLTPGGWWYIDSRCSNCTMPDDDEHRCWVRHGEAPNITVDKNGNTCQAGAGSIQCGDYHGFLRDGCLVLG